MILGPTPGPLDADDVVAAYPWPDGRRWVRAMMVTTLDGAAAGPDGLSGSISGEADKLVFDAVRRHADAVLIGAETLRAERYGPMRAKEEDAEARRAKGLAPAPQLVVVSRSLELPWDEPVFAESALPVLVLTDAAADPDRVARASAWSEVVSSRATANPGRSSRPSSSAASGGSSARAGRPCFVISWPRTWSTRPTSPCRP